MCDAPTYSCVQSQRDGDNIYIEFIYRDEDDIPEKFTAVFEKDQVVSNCDSARLLEAVYRDITGHIILLHRKYFNIGYRYFYRIMQSNY